MEIVPEQNFAVLAELFLMVPYSHFVIAPLVVQKDFAEVLIGHLLRELPQEEMTEVLAHLPVDKIALAEMLLALVE